MSDVKLSIYEGLVREHGDPAEQQGHEDRVKAIIERADKKRRKTTPTSSSASPSGKSA